MVRKFEKWHLVYYEDSKGTSEIFDFVNSKKDREKAKILAFLKILEENGPNLPRPYADILLDGIHELRIKLSGNQIRILYFFCFRHFIVLTHAFTKTTDRVFQKELERAKRFRSDFLNRNNESSLRKDIHENS